MTEEERQQKREQELKDYLGNDLVQYYKETYKGYFHDYLIGMMPTEVFILRLIHSITDELKMFQECKKLNEVFIEYFENSLQGNSLTQDTKRLKQKIAQAKSLKKESDDLIRGKRKGSLSK